MKKQQVVPLIQQDLSHEETIIQIANALDTLQQLVNNAFTNVESNIERQKNKLSNIHTRCVKASQKIETLRGINKSIRVLSSYKYPGPNINTFYKYEYVRPDLPKEENIRIPYTPLTSDKLTLKEKLNFYHVKDTLAQLRINDEMTTLNNLGNMSTNIKSVNSLFLYNTSQNLYTDYKILDPLSFYNKKSENVEITSIEPPISLSSHEHVKRYENYFYAPSIQDVPDIEAPLNLPHLSGIADDLQFEDEIKILKTESIVIKDEKEDEEEPIVIDLPKLESVNQILVETVPPPPPPPPPPVIEQLEIPIPVQKTIPVKIDARANLMEAIRQAGGTAKLKKNVSESPVVKKSTGNLMDDLHAKLSMRRKGISGKIDNPEGMFDKIVTMIPIPTPMDEPDNDDDDWDD